MGRVHVAVAVIARNPEYGVSEEILISKRPDHVHQGGLWEFPGGKVEDKESVIDALARELDEELGIQIDRGAESLEPLIQIHHDYGDKHVCLDVWRLDVFDGMPHGKEGQPVRWVPREQLDEFAFPAANVPILAAAVLPRTYVITPEYRTIERAINGLDQLARSGVELALFRQPQLDELTYRQWSQVLFERLDLRAMKLMGSGDPGQLSDLPFAGVQLPWHIASTLTERPLGKGAWLGVSCHDSDQLAHALAIDADFVTLSPVCQTLSHPESMPLGWKTFSELVRNIPRPVYALGGLSEEDRASAISYGAQGLAGIRAWQLQED